ncbi:MAG TPA: hypothetical protein ENK65_02020 [Helicobacteraceae bacterium]|nr:hypothetical protein [Helicobacteraceae bacterium]
MQEIEEKAITTYHNNLAYCQKEHPALASKLTALDMLLNDGRYPTQYDLEYKEGYFDVKELATGNYLYKDNPQHLTQKILTNIDYKKNSNVLETFYNLSFSDAALEKVEASDAFTVHATSAPIIHYCNSVVNPNMHMKHIYKHIILGTGLGLHLPELVAKVKAQTYFIVEENLELFRLSLFTCDYATIFSNSTLFFSVAENDSEFKASFDAFYLNAFVRNHYLKFSLFNDTHTGKIKQMQSAIVSRPEIAYSHEYLLFKHDLLLQRIPLNYAFLDLSPKDTSSI